MTSACESGFIFKSDEAGRNGLTMCRENSRAKGVLGRRRISRLTLFDAENVISTPSVLCLIAVSSAAPLASRAA